MTTYFRQFELINSKYSLIIEDNGIVAYAFLLKDNSIVGDVWLYNQEETPRKPHWDNPENAPFLNPIKYVKDRKRIVPLTEEDDIVVKWNKTSLSVCVILIYRNSNVFRLCEGSKPGWSNVVNLDGPLAKVFNAEEMLNLIISENQSRLTGVALTEQEGNDLNSFFSSFFNIELITKICRSYKIIGHIFSIDEEKDISGTGIEMQWMTSEEQINEVTDCYPGSIAIKVGLFPIGKCLEGSGDYYYLDIKSNDLLLVRVPHDIESASSIKEEVESVVYLEDLMGLI